MNEQQETLLKEATENAAKILFIAFKTCELKSHISFICEIEGKLYKMTFEAVEK